MPTHVQMYITLIKPKVLVTVALYSRFWCFYLTFKQENLSRIKTVRAVSVYVYIVHGIHFYPIEVVGPGSEIQFQVN